jgi:LPXTG-motif cell wall-anchored protein
MNTFRRISLAATVAVVSLGSVAFTTVPATAATTSCTVKAINTRSATSTPANRFGLNSDGSVTSTFMVSGDENCQQAVTLADWQAPTGKDAKGQPYDKQKLFKFVTGTFGVGTHTLTVQLPDCYYQVDLVRGSSPTDANGGPLYGKPVMMAALHGGTQACVTPTPPTPTSPTTPTPQTPVMPQQPTSLPNTGAGSNIFLGALGASVLGAAFQYARQLRARRGLAQ